MLSNSLPCGVIAMTTAPSVLLQTLKHDIIQDEYQQNDAADERNQSDQCPPTALIRVVKASDEYSQCWHDSGQRPDQADDATAAHRHDSLEVAIKQR